MGESMKNKVVWVVGASSGIGEAIARKFFTEGANLVISARREDRLKALQEELEGSDSKKTGQSRIAVLPLDITETSRAEEHVREAMAQHGCIDIVVFSSGVSNRGSVLKTSLEVHREVMEINYFGVVALSKVLLQAFVEAGSGSFIVINSVQGKFGIPDRSPYAASKHALNAFFECLRYESDRSNVKVLMMYPGYVKTELSLNALTADGSKHAAMDQNTATGFSPSYVADRTFAAFVSGKEEVVVAQAKAHVAVALKAYLPSLFSGIMKRRAKSKA